jgi:DNA-directed RNA polymerase specialized sigma24 family protein
MIEMRAPEQLTVPELIGVVRREITQSLQQRPTGSAYAFELFRRALALRDERAWAGMYDLYHTLVGSWIRRCAATTSSEDLASLEHEVFARWYRSISPQRLQHFPSVHALLAYLKRCASSVATDHHRSCQTRRQREDMVDLIEQEPALDDPADLVLDQLAAREVWHIIDGEVTCQDERLILQQVIVLGWPPREVQRCYPALFPGVQDVCRVKRNLLERLRRNQQLLAPRAQTSDRPGERSASEQRAEAEALEVQR